MIYKFGIFKPGKPDYIHFFYSEIDKKYKLYTTSELKMGDIIYKIKPTNIPVNVAEDKVLYFIDGQYAEVNMRCFDIYNGFIFRFFDNFIRKLNVTLE